MSEIIGPIDYTKLKQKFAESLREELTSEILLSAVLRDSTGAELSSHIENLDVLLSTRASEETLAEIRSLLSTRASEETLAEIRSLLSTRASEETLAEIRSLLSTRASEETLAEIRSLLSTRASEETLAEIGALVLFASTTTPLASNATWVSPTESGLNTGRIVGSVFANQAGQICVDQSPNGTNWDVIDCFDVIANQGLGFSVEKIAQYARVRYVNGAAAQTVFRLYVYRRLRVI